MNGYDRREFMTTALAAGILQLTACRERPPNPAEQLSKARVVIAGGGFAGVNAARALKRLAPSLTVTLIERNEKYLSCPGSNQVIAGIESQDALIHDYSALSSNHGVAVLNADITGIDPSRRSVVLGDGSEVPYDRLIVAPGVDFRWDAIEGYDVAASLTIPHAWKAGPQTLLLQKQLQALRNGGVVVITVPDNPYRCPPGPYERASLIAYYLKRRNPRSKVLILDAKTRFSKQALFLQGWRELYPGKVEWLSSEKEGKIDHIDARKRTVHTEFGIHRADVLNVIPPQQAGKLAHLAGLTDSSGWCPVYPLSFESTLIPGIHVIGDACIATPMPKSAFSAQSQARLCAAAVVALLIGKPPALPRLINHCYSFLDPDNAISVTGVYGYQPIEKQLTALSTGETPLDGDRRLEAEHARDWYALFMRETFS